LTGKNQHKILVVDDERSMREFLEILLSKEGYQVFLAGSGEEACRMLDQEHFDLLITDIKMKDINGIDVLKRAKEISPDSIVIMISAFATAETAVEAMKEGAYDYIPKPFKVNEFKKIVRDALEAEKKVARRAEGASSIETHLGFLVGDSPQMKKVYDLIPARAEPVRNW